MSRYLRVTTGLHDRERLLAGLRALGLRVEPADARMPLMLAGSLECAGEPVELRVAGGQRGAIEDFGFARPTPEAPYELVCGEYDRAHLETQLLAPLRAELAVIAAHEIAARDGLRVEETLDADGTRRIKLRRS